MPKSPISVTLGAENLVWLKGRARALGARSVSETLDRIVTEARLGGAPTDAAIRSVVGTIDIAPDDPDLAGADAYLRQLFDASVQRPVVARDKGAGYRSPTGGGTRTPGTRSSRG
ncbi:MAG: hypothetical protein R2752_21855 [Vicinamibacterales bacterium]